MQVVVATAGKKGIEEGFTQIQVKKIIIIGAGSVGGHVAHNLQEYNLKGELLGFLDDDSNKIGSMVFGRPVLGPVSEIINYQGVQLILGIAFPEIKKHLHQQIVDSGDYHFPTLVAENAWVSKNVELGKGTIIYPGCSINYNSRIGDFVIMNLNCAIGHDTTIGKMSSLAPGVNTAGHTYIGECVDVGIGVATKQSVRIGDNAVIGGQSMIIRDVSDGQLVKGVPGR